MSNQVNTELFEEAAEIIDEGYINKYDFQTLEQAIKLGDLDMVRTIIVRYRRQMREMGDEY